MMLFLGIMPNIHTLKHVSIRATKVLQSVCYVTYETYSINFTKFDPHTAHFTAAEQYGMQ